MTKIITLEKGDDGVYTATGKVEEAIKEEPKVYKVQEVKRQQPKRRRKNPIYDEQFETEDVHKFIAKNGDKASEFLKGVQTSVNAFNLIKKMIK
jgi:hypothetical protein